MFKYGKQFEVKEIIDHPYHKELVEYLKSITVENPSIAFFMYGVIDKCPVCLNSVGINDDTTWHPLFSGYFDIMLKLLGTDFDFDAAPFATSFDHSHDSIEEATYDEFFIISSGKLMYAGRVA